MLTVTALTVVGFIAVIALAGPTERPSAASVVTSRSPALQVPVGVTSAAPVGLPVRVTVPRLKIDSSLQALGLEADGSLQSPSLWQVAGWYAEGLRPGEVGPAVIAGHVDSTSGPAVFYQLPHAVRGDDIDVTDDLGVTRHFTVIDIDAYPKDRFPSQAVYGPAAVATLRLVTCYGAFDAKARSYVDNLVVTAVLSS